MRNGLYAQILDLLENDANTAIEDIALMVGASQAQVKEAIEDMEKAENHRQVCGDCQIEKR